MPLITLALRTRHDAFGCGRDNKKSQKQAGRQPSMPDKQDVGFLKITDIFQNTKSFPKRRAEETYLSIFKATGVIEMKLIVNN
jgi:hypothetical protein